MSSPKTVLITGCSSGIGKFAAKKFLSEGYIVVFTGRSDNGLKTASEWITAGLPDKVNNLHGIALDLEDLDSINKVVDQFRALNLPKLDILINNAGRMVEKAEFTKETERLEKTIFANAIGPWYLTLRLLPFIPSNTGHILFITSQLYDITDVSHGFPQSSVLAEAKFEDFDGHKDYDSLAFYRVSKLVQFWLTLLLAEQLKEQNIATNLMCPGLVPSTNLVRTSFMLRLFIRSVSCIRGLGITEDQSAENYYKVTTSSSLKDVTATYFREGEITEPNEPAKDMVKAKQFWNLACDICHIPERKYNCV